jgi:hypothetical protein
MLIVKFIILMKEKLLNFIAPFLSYIDNGKLFREPFGWLYMILAVLNGLLPFYILYKAIDSKLFEYGTAKMIAAFVLIWLVILLACWIGLQIWWNRKDSVLQSSQEGSQYPATPVITHFIQTLGEWLGTLVAIIGCGFSLIATVFLGKQAGYLGSSLGLPFDGGIIGIILFPIYGFLIVVTCRFLAEQCRAVVDIANNTKK